MDVDEDGQDIYEVQSQVSYNGDETESEVSPAQSRYSYAPSRDGRSLFREIAGRKLNDTNGQYLLPSGELRFYLFYTLFSCLVDEGEHSRLYEDATPSLKNFEAVGVLNETISGINSTSFICCPSAVSTFL